MSKTSKRHEELVHQLHYEMRAAGAAQDALDEAAMQQLGINRTDGRCMDILDRDGPLTAGRLAELANLSPAAMTTVVDRLERAGYARRVRDEGDRRRVVVELTEKARKRAMELWGPIGEEADGILARYDDAELELLRDFMRASRELQQAHAARIRSSA